MPRYRNGILNLNFGVTVVVSGKPRSRMGLVMKALPVLSRLQYDKYSARCRTGSPSMNISPVTHLMDHIKGFASPLYPTSDRSWP